MTNREGKKKSNFASNLVQSAEETAGCNVLMERLPGMSVDTLGWRFHNREWW